MTVVMKKQKASKFIFLLHTTHIVPFLIPLLISTSLKYKSTKYTNYTPALSDSFSISTLVIMYVYQIKVLANLYLCFNLLDIHIYFLNINKAGL